MSASRLQPATLEALRDALQGAHARRERIEAVDLRALGRVVEHRPEDMTVTVEAGLDLAALQAALAKQGQWLPVDPPNARQLAIGRLLNANTSGPRRFGYGGIREHLLGLKVVLPDGRVIRSGGKVVKNVAGYDLLKLFVGAQGTLGVIVEATFKVRPRPAVERFVTIRGLAFEEGASLIDQVMRSEMAPIVLDLHRLAGPAFEPTLVMVVGFAGTAAEVEWQIDALGQLSEFEDCTLEYEERFWAAEAGIPVHRRSVLPSQVTEAARSLAGVDLVARAGNGILYYRGGTPPPKTDGPRALLQRVKDAFDPHHVLPELPS